MAAQCLREKLTRTKINLGAAFTSLGELRAAAAGELRTADTQQNECAFAGPLAFVSTLAKSFSFVVEETISNNVECKYLVL